MYKNFTIETRIPKNSYFEEFITFYNQIYRYAYHQMKNKDFKEMFKNNSKFHTHLCEKFNILKRTASAIRNDIEGRINALKELMETQASDLLNKINDSKSRIEDLKQTINKLKPKVAKNSASKKELDKYRISKQKYYHECNHLCKLTSKYNKLKYKMDNEIYDITFGGKAFFKKQYNLEDNGYKTHEKWYNDFVKQRDKNIFYFGSKDETSGNQLAQLSYNKNKDTFDLKIRLEKNYVKDSKYMIIRDIRFSYMKEELINALINKNDPIHIRIKRRLNKWYLQCIFRTMRQKELTRKDYGTIGLDLNYGFIELAETNETGNLINLKHYNLDKHAKGNKAKTEMELVVSKIVNYAKTQGKDLVIENIDFKKKKSLAVSRNKKNKKYNRMIHTFDYSRYKFLIENKTHRVGVNLIKVNPKYTSIIGNRKYSKPMKLSVHQAASFVIARKGQGYRDKF